MRKENMKGIEMTCKRGRAKDSNKVELGFWIQILGTKKIVL